MGKAEEESDFKSRLVAEICSISSRSVTCHRFHHSIKPPFVDWYLLLRVEEDADIDIIRKQYRKLALLLHPDKNRHPKAEIAFKLVSEAYSCLSDKIKRRTFDSERRKGNCNVCNTIPYVACNISTDRARSNKILHRLREVRNRFREEAKTIENCLKSHNHLSRDEFPLFNPSDYLFKDYPHPRAHQIYRKPEDIGYLRAGNNRNYDHRRGKCESPIFELRSETRPIRSKSACLSS